MNTLHKAGFQIVDFFRKTKTLALYNQLISSQWASKEDLLIKQFNGLKDLLIHASEHVPVYKKIFKESEFDPFRFSDFSDLKKIPIISKDEIRSNFDEFKAENFFKYKPRITQTGGSTGKPLITYKDKISHSYLWANNFRAWNTAGFVPGDKFIQIASGSLLTNVNSIKRTLYNFFQNSIIITSYHIDNEKLRLITKQINSSKAKFIYGYSSSLYLISSFCKENNINISNSLSAIFTTSDMLLKSQRKVIEDVFDTDVYDIYGCPEGGILSFECSQHDGYHLNQESVFVEVENINTDGFGNIIATPLYNYAFPLIRYNTGDVGKLTSETCKCGRKLIKIKELGGRIRDFIKLKDGRYIHGAFFNHLESLYKSNWIKQYQIIQESIDELTLRFSLNSEPIKSDLESIKSDLKKGLLPDLKINFDFSGVQYTGGGKFRLINSNVNNQWDIKD